MFSQKALHELPKKIRILMFLKELILINQANQNIFVTISIF